MKLIIKNPAPAGKNREKWGDFHFGRSMSKYLVRCGVQVTTHYHEDWHQDNDADAILVLRGKYRYHPSRGCLNVLWCMSNPSTVGIDECNEYDAVCVASTQHAQTIAQRCRVPVYPLLQCTDPEEFEITSGAERQGLIFVGNTRGVRRPCVDWALAQGYDISIYGRGWKDFGLGSRVGSEYIANERLPALYASARASLNDHWQDMKGLGYVNNRVFDCLAARLPIVSDDFPELRSICGNRILYYNDSATLAEALRQVDCDYHDVKLRQDVLWMDIRERFSFGARAEFIVNLIRTERTSSSSAYPSRAADGYVETRAFHRAQLPRIVHELKTVNGGRFCPLCGAKPYRFSPSGAGRRLDAKCPSCGCLERHRLFWLFFVNDVHPRLPHRLKQMLHITPDGHLARALHELDDINYLSADGTRSDVMVQTDPCRLDFPNERFDLMVSIYAMDRIMDDEQAMRELQRCLKVGGIALIMIPMRGAVTRIINDAAPLEGQITDVVRRVYGSDIVELLARVGFEVTLRRFSRELQPDVARCAAVRDQAVLECRKISLT